MASGPPTIFDIARLDSSLARASKQGVTLVGDRACVQSQQTPYTTTTTNELRCYQSRHTLYRGATDLRLCYTNTSKAENPLYNDIFVSCAINAPSQANYSIGSSQRFPVTIGGVRQARISPGGKVFSDGAGLEYPAGTIIYVTTSVSGVAIGDQWGLGQICYGSGLLEGISPIGVDLTRPNITITACTKANPGVFTTAVPHGLVVGQKIFITGMTGTVTTNWNKNDGTSGAPNANSGSPTVAKTVNTVPSTTTFTIDTGGTILDTSAFAGTYNASTGYVGGPSDYTNNIYTYGPSLIMGLGLPFENTSVAIIGDSIAYGVNNNGNYNNGFIQRALSSAGIPWTNLGVSGDTVASWCANGGHILRGDYAGYCTHAIIQYGTNDIAAGNSAATIWANLQTMAANLIRRGITPIICTVPPKTTSSDVWATVANQTVDGFASVRNTLNNTILSSYLSGGFSYVINTADLVEVNSSGVLTHGGNYWTPALTGDGVHLLEAGQVVAAAGVTTAINAGAISFN